MKRRNFAQSIVAGLGLSSLPVGASLALKSTVNELHENLNVTTTDGLKLKLSKQKHPTQNKDKKQFILTYDVENRDQLLHEKIYELKLANGTTQQVFMTPVNNNQLQAVFNWRLNG